MSGDPDEPSEMAEGIVGVSVYEAPEPSKKDFYAWHRPRKQFVRDRQWCVQVLRLLDDCAAFGDGDGLLKYLGLPGSDLLDIRCFYEEICKPKGLGLRFLGFNSGADPKSEQQTELNISLDEVTKLDGVDSQSQIIPDDIRRVANEESIAWSRVFKLGPFDVINLDLCDGFGTDAGGKFNDTYYNAMAHLLALQARQKTPWLLLLTTRVGNAHVDTETFALLLKRYAENLDGCADFKTESKQAFDIHDKATLDTAVGTEVGIQRIFLTGVCKWLLGMAVKQNPPSTVEVKSVLGYRVEKDAAITDLVSVAVRFTPQHSPAEDPSQLSKTKKKVPDECALAVKALKRVSKLADVDQILGGDKALRDSMFEKMKLLLVTARYDMDAYAVWDAQQ